MALELIMGQFEWALLPVRGNETSGFNRRPTFPSFPTREVTGVIRPTPVARCLPLVGILGW